ncbi:Protein tyrosine phosphatase type IVA 3 [Irineochytrium annulatum]|nr:Protein tyrosine phosphatase type IVA 3 [Irineochytrium annulatum]
MPSRTIPFSRVMTSIEYKNFRFVVFDCPTEATLPMYCEELKSRGVTDVVRVCEPTYDRARMEENGIRLVDWPFADGSIPPSAVIHGFLQMCDDRFHGGISGSGSSSSSAAVTTTSASADSSENNNSGPAIAVHCVAGLGRAPVLVAIALIESGMASLDAVEYVRARRRGAFNTIQLAYLDSYKRSWRKGGVKLQSLLTKRSASPGGSTGTSPPPVVGSVGMSAAVAGEEQAARSAGRGIMNKVFGGFSKKM